jgi:GNAT superfamily N-acetyltransferase
MGWRTTCDVTEFLAAAGAFLRAERARNTVFLTVTETIRANLARTRAGTARTAADPVRLPLFGWWTDDSATPAGGAGPVGEPGPVQGAFLHTPPFPVLLTAVPPEAAADLAAKTLTGRSVPGVNSYEKTATAFAAAWRERTGCRVDVGRRTRLYRLAELTWPQPLPDGAPRPAGESDAALATGWFTAFRREVREVDGADHAAAFRDRVSYGGLILWELGGVPVSMAGFTRRVAGMVRVGPVYTPPELRGHGYASAVTAEASRAALADGAEEVLLYTDLANPVSNSIYQRIGYRPVEDRIVLSFGVHI